MCQQSAREVYPIKLIFLYLLSIPTYACDQLINQGLVNVTDYDLAAIHVYITDHKALSVVKCLRQGFQKIRGKAVKKQIRPIYNCQELDKQQFSEIFLLWNSGVHISTLVKLFHSCHFKMKISDLDQMFVIGFDMQTWFSNPIKGK